HPFSTAKGARERSASRRRYRPAASRQRRACLEIGFLVAQATRLYRPATVSVYRSADFQSAVSPICNRQSLGDSPAFASGFGAVASKRGGDGQDPGIRARSAGYKPAI